MNPPDDLVDTDLLTRWQQGSDEAARALIDRYAARLHRFFASKAVDDPSELVQETLADCVAAHQKVRDDGDRLRFRAFVFTVARRKLYNHYRTWCRHGARVDPLLHSVVALQTGLGSQLERGRQGGALHLALRELPLDAQIALELLYWEGLSVAEIASVVGAPAGTIKARLSRARTQLRTLLQDRDSSVAPSCVR